MNDKAIVAAVLGVILASMVAGFSYIWKHVETNSVTSRTARVIQQEIVKPVLEDHESRIRDIEHKR